MNNNRCVGGAKRNDSDGRCLAAIAMARARREGEVWREREREREPISPHGAIGLISVDGDSQYLQRGVRRSSSEGDGHSDGERDGGRGGARGDRESK